MKRYWIVVAAVPVLLVLVALGAGRRSEPVPVADSLADTDNPADQVRALVGELAARDKRLRGLEERLNQLTRRRPAEAESLEMPEPAPAPQPQQEVVIAADLRSLTEQLRQFSRQLETWRSVELSEARPLPPDPPPAPSGVQVLDTAAVLPAQQQVVWLPAEVGDPPVAAAEQPQFRVPAGTTATDVLLVTSLIGRIPRSGQVVSPLPFKALVGPTVLVAPGHLLPELRGAVIMGDVVGDLLLNCVRGHVRRITLVGDNGDYASVAADGNQSLGYLSDERGNPCLPGQLVTDFPRTLLAAGLASSVEAAGQALAAEQRIQQQDLASIRLLTEDSSEFLGGSALAGGASTLVDWIRARSSDSFDAVVVPSGGKAVANFTSDLEFLSTGQRLGWQR